MLGLNGRQTKIDKATQEIERRAQRAEALARGKVEADVAARVNVYATKGVDADVRVVMHAIDAAMNRANKSVPVSYLALVAMTDIVRQQYVATLANKRA